MARLIPKPKGFCCAPQVVPTDISHFQKSAHPNFRNRSDTKPFDQTQQNMTTNCNRLALHQEITTKHACAHECLATVEGQSRVAPSTCESQYPMGCLYAICDTTIRLCGGQEVHRESKGVHKMAIRKLRSARLDSRRETQLRNAIVAELRRPDDGQMTPTLPVTWA